MNDKCEVLFKPLFSYQTKLAFIILRKFFMMNHDYPSLQKAFFSTIYANFEVLTLSRSMQGDVFLKHCTHLITKFNITNLSIYISNWTKTMSIVWISWFLRHNLFIFNYGTNKLRCGTWVISQNEIVFLRSNSIVLSTNYNDKNRKRQTTVIIDLKMS